MGKPYIHADVTIDRLMSLAEGRDEGLENPGVCLACGEDQGECEPDAREYTCEGCGEPAVYGVEELIVCGWYHDGEDA